MDERGRQPVAEIVVKSLGAAKLFSIMHVSSNDISAQNLRMRDGEASSADIARHADAWIRANQKRFDAWIAEAMSAAR